MEKNKLSVKKRSEDRVVSIVFVLLEVAFLIFLVSLFPNLTTAVLGEDNVTVTTTLTVGTVRPEVINVTINNENAIDLSPNDTVVVDAIVVIRDYNGEGDIGKDNITARFFDSDSSGWGNTSDNNHHYRNVSCTPDYSYGGGGDANYLLSANCSFWVYYYALNSTWNATVTVVDNSSLRDNGSDLEIINGLLALGLPESIDYGLVNSSFVSFEQAANVTNFGNLRMNLSLEGYARTRGDNYSMNCTLGSNKNITIGHEKYNLTATTAGTQTLTQFEDNYINLTSNVTIRSFNLNLRKNDTDPYFGDTNATYWRMYVPVGPAGSCRGNIIFGATSSSGWGE